MRLDCNTPKLELKNAKTILRFIYNEKQVVFITLWPVDETETSYVAEFANGPRVSLIRRNESITNRMDIRKRFSDIGIKIDFYIADMVINLIRDAMRIS
ncbi:hypothetical protein [Kosakonia phage 305]|uniref:Uncharacterized protein n=1 Tax=Kosakonia phage 305 TaxID=2863193 RepID=A0AAE7WFN5_9CAUD|nr:hypothetical protein PP421_gp080 [Kosakonia phage 305]QYN80231.1 hypothetical protein [Kosakonia phage 305]